MFGDRLLGLRGRPEGLLKLGLMTPPVGVVVSGGGGGAATLSALTPSSFYTNDPTYNIAKARDGDPATRWSSNGDASTLRLTGSSAFKLRYIGQVLAQGPAGQAYGKVIVAYSDNGGSSWTNVTDGTLTFPAWATGTYTSGTTQAVTLADNGAHVDWLITPSVSLDNSSIPGYASVAEFIFATDTAGTNLVTGP